MTISRSYNNFIRKYHISDFLNLLRNVIELIIRIWVSKIYYNSGLTKLSNWEQTLFLFEYEYQVPLIPVNIAALLATSAELICPILLVLGIFSRISVIPLLVMTLIIEFFIIANQIHLYWILMMCIILTNGSGNISIDYFINKKFKFHRL